MGSFDNATWTAIGLVLTLMGLGISYVLWRRRGPASGIRGVAWSLLPLAAGLTRTLHLASDIGGDIASWAVHLVFSPIVWAGVVLAGVSVVLFGVSGAMRNRGVGGSSGAKKADAVTPGASRPPAKPPKGSSKPSIAEDDMDDIEAILKKHGIS